MGLNYTIYEKHNQSAVITIDRESVYNALNKDAKFEIIDNIKKANADSDIRSIIITAMGKAFCTGQDLNDRNIASSKESVDLGHTLESEWIPLMKSIRESDKPVIAAVNGVCAGAGLSLALTCDLIVANQNVRFISGFSKLGLVPDAGSTYLLSRVLGYQKSLEFFLLNEPLYSEDLEHRGLINKVCEDAKKEAFELSLKINELPPLSVKAIKKNVQLAYEESYEKTLLAETYYQRELGKSEDYAEGVKAFFEKRKAVFKGK